MEYAHVRVQYGRRELKGRIEVRTNCIVLTRELTFTEKTKISAKSTIDAACENPSDVIGAAAVAAAQSALKAGVKMITGTNTIAKVKGTNDYAKSLSYKIAEKKKAFTPQPKKLLILKNSSIQEVSCGALGHRYVEIRTTERKYTLHFGGIVQHFDFYKELCKNLGWA